MRYICLKIDRKYVTMITISLFLAVITCNHYARVTLHVITSVGFIEISTLCVISYTVNSEIFVRVLFSQNFTYAKFRENKISRNAKITLSFIYIRKSWPSCEF